MNLLQELLHGEDIDYEVLLPICDQYQLATLKVIQAKAKSYPEETIKKWKMKN